MEQLAASPAQSAAQFTLVSLDRMQLCESPSLYDRADFGRFFRGRSGSCGFVDYKPEEVEERARRLVSEDSATSNSSFSFSVEVGLTKSFRLSKFYA